jgi:hypothetical protein
MSPATIPARCCWRGSRPVLDLAKPVQVDNRVRPFIYLPGKWLGAEPRAVPLNEP